MGHWGQYIGYMMQTLGGWMFYWIYAANIWRKYVILRVSVCGMNIFYWMCDANIWEYMSVGGFLWALRAQGWEMYCGEKSPTAFSCTLASQHFPTRQRIRFPTAACSMQTSTSEIWCNSFRDTCHHISQPCQGLQSSFSPAWRRLQGNAKMFRSEAWGTWSRPQPCPYFIVYKRCSVGCVVVVGGRRVMYTIENHLFHPPKGAPQKRDDLPRKKGTLLVPFLRCPPSILMGNGGGTPPPPSLFTGAHFGFHLITEWSAGPFIHLLSHLCPIIHDISGSLTLNASVVQPFFRWHFH